MSQDKLFEKKKSGPVSCLGMTFESDETRRQYFTEKLREKLKDPEFRKIEGFPLGQDEDILALSDPPYYTACPNPWIADFIKEWQTEKAQVAGKDGVVEDQPYDRKPFAADVSEGKNDPIYKAHSYHTKVPHKAIMRYILHYTDPGDIVFDGFCGTGMTGVAAQSCGSAPSDYRTQINADFEKQGNPKPLWGERRVVLNDLSPIASFIASNYNIPFDVREFATAGRRILNEVEKEIGWMYHTLHTDGTTKGRIEYTVWSEVFSCPNCAGEVVFLNEALDHETKSVKDVFPCPHCGSQLTKNNVERIFETKLDPADGKPWKRVKYVPSRISYLVNQHRYEKQPDSNDMRVLSHISQLPLPPEIPTTRFPIEQMYHGSRLAPKGFTHVHHFFLPRAAHALAVLWRKTLAYHDRRLRHMLLFFVEQAILGMTLMNRHHVVGRANVNQWLTGVYYIPSIHEETAYWRILEGKLDRLTKAFQTSHSITGTSMLTTGTASQLSIPSNSIDYVFTDPPFGENIYYADMNFLMEAWHRVITNTTAEAIIDNFKDKGLPEYQHLMQKCFEEYYRVLKPSRWITVVFHNSRNSVWNAIQESLQFAGFVVADVRTLDKQQGSYRQLTSMAVKQDLVISAYKPNRGFEERFQITAASEEGVWDFVRTHLRQLPVFVSKDGQADIIAERQNYLLFDRMVAFHVQRGVTVPLSAAGFYAGLVRRFSERDGMYFLPEQVAEYDKRRMTVREVLQLQFVVTDESSAIQWLKQKLVKKPQTFQEIHPQFMKEIGGWQKHEKPLELMDMLEQNFIKFDDNGPIPSQIVSWLKCSEKYRPLINQTETTDLTTKDTALLVAAKDRWYVPDPNKQIDLEKVREKALLKEFDEYKTGVSGAGTPGAKKATGQKLKVFRIEAVRAGFKKAYQDRDYETIISVAKRIPETVLQEDDKLLMWYDQALTRTEG